MNDGAMMALMFGGGMETASTTLPMALIGLAVVVVGAVWLVATHTTAERSEASIPQSADPAPNPEAVEGERS